MRIIKMIGLLFIFCLHTVATAAVCNDLETYVINTTNTPIYAIFNTITTSTKVTISNSLGMQLIGTGTIDLLNAVSSSAITFYSSDKYDDDSEIFYSIIQKLLNDGPVTETDSALLNNRYEIAHTVLTNGNCANLIPGRFLYIITKTKS